jgi:hypothetical protein
MKNLLFCPSAQMNAPLLTGDQFTLAFAFSQKPASWSETVKRGV